MTSYSDEAMDLDQPSFSDALVELERGDSAIDAGVLSALSGASRGECATFAARFAEIPATRRQAIIKTMVESAERRIDLDFHDLLRRCLNDTDAVVRLHAVEGLWEDQRSLLLRPLLRMLENDPAPAVRASVASMLGRFVWSAVCDEIDEARADALRSALLKVAQSPTEPIEVVRRAIEALSFINDEEIKRLIDRAYAHPEHLMRVSAVFAMGRSADKFWTETVLAELYSESPELRYEAARACGEMQTQRAVKALISMSANDPDAEVQAMSIWALGQIGGDEAEKTLRMHVEGDNEALIKAAEDALQEIEFANPSFDLLSLELDDEDLVDPFADGADFGSTMWPAGGDDMDEDEDEDDQDTIDEWADEPLDLG